MAHETNLARVVDRLRAASRQGYSLRQTLIARILLPLLIVMVLLAVIGLRTLESAMESRMKEDVELIARAVRLPISESLSHGEYTAVRQALESVFQIGRVYGASVYDPEGEVVASVGAFDPLPDHRSLSDRAAADRAGGGYERIEGRRVYAYYEPLTDAEGRTTGLLQIMRRGSDFREDIAHLRFQAYGFLGGAAALITFLVLVGHRGAIGRHLGALMASMTRIEAGDRDHRTALRGPSEVRALSAAFNTMLDSMQSAEAEIARRRSDQARLEQELRHAEKLAAIGRLAAGVAHELGTPLSVIDGKAQRALRRVDTDSREGVALQHIRGEVERMEHIVRQLLEFGRAANRSFRWTRIGDLAAAATASLDDSLRAADARVELPENRAEVAVCGDPVRLEQVLVNLVRNAIQAGASRVRIDWDGDDPLTVWVDDDGPGIPAEVRERLFEPFFTTRAVGDGTGLGLAVVHGIITEHGGSVVVADSPDGGARFCIVLPRDARDSHDVHADNDGSNNDDDPDDDAPGTGPADRG
ncbi:MAG: ATP-binding protein [Ectothiorhodospiraceae bacterium]